MKQIILAMMLLLYAESAAAQDAPFASLVTHLSETAIRDIVISAQSSQQVPQESYSDIEARVFAWLNWGTEEIEWFRTVYVPMYGDGEGYIRDIYEAMLLLETLQTPP